MARLFHVKYPYFFFLKYIFYVLLVDEVLLFVLTLIYFIISFEYSAYRFLSVQLPFVCELNMTAIIWRRLMIIN